MTEAAANIKTDIIHNGLTEYEARQKLKEQGKNTIETEAATTALSMFLSQFPTVINGILTIAAIFSFFVSDILDGVFLVAIVIMNAVLGFIQEYRAQRSLEKLKTYTAPSARVIRNSKENQILAENIVTGDIVILAEGARIPADGKLLEATHLEIDESVLTGESLAVIKNENDEVYSGTLVTKGKGIFRVEKTGTNTQFGQIAHTLSTIQSEKTPLQKSLEYLGKTISYAALIVGLLIIPIGIFQKAELLPLILVAASIGIAAIPEGLPAVVTIAFAVGTHMMAKRGAIVRKMAAVETLGSIQAILVDKTGTITENSMKVKKSWIKDDEKLPLLIEACVLGNTASLVEKGTGKDYDIIGDQTDGALLLWAKEQTKTPLPKDGHVLDEYVFDTDTKTITTVWKQNGKRFVFVRGAPEVIIDKCLLSEKEKESITTQYEALAQDGLRVIGFAIKTDSHQGKVAREHLEKDLHFLGLIGMFDPPRDEVKEAVRKARTAGIHVMMVTGDNELTALSLAKDISLIEKDEDVINGEELGKMTDEELGEIILKTSIFARTKPEQKLRIVTILKEQGVIVGVTGDGVNDSLALKKADVGVAMGKGGTDVAKEAADIIITDNNFATIIRAIEEGRTIYKNITNAVLYLLSGNLAEISLVFFATLFQLPFPLLPTQILWINLVTDSLPALALATGSKDPTVLQKKPRDPRERILTSRRIFQIFLIGFSLSGILLVIFSLLLQYRTEAQARTVTFNLLIYFHLIIVMLIGRHSWRRGNFFLQFTVLLILIIQILITVTPFFQQIFHLEL